MKFVDIQVNGYAGVDFNADPISEEDIQFVAERLNKGNVGAILATVVTDDLSLMSQRLSNLRNLIDQDDRLRELIPAFHIEGPCLSPIDGYRGAHPAEHTVPASREVLEPLIESAGGAQRVAIVTLAPEVDKDLATIQWLADQGITVAAGHTDASLDVLRRAEQAGLKLFTHLGNGSAARMDRHDNIIYRAMSLERIRYSLIPDGHHLPFYVMKNWLRWLGVDRCVFTTDCINAADAPLGFKLPDWRVVDTTGDTPVARLKGTEPSYLAGAVLTMQQAYRNAVEHVDLSETEAKALCSDQPAELIRKWLNGVTCRGG